MEFWREALILLGGLWAGTINTIVGSGSLVTFPILVALGYAPVNAVISNAMGLVAGGFSGAWGYRREAASVPRTLLKLLPASLLGGLAGAYLLLHLPETVFGYVAPVLIVVALALVIFQPRLSAWAKRRQDMEHVEPEQADAQRLSRSSTSSCSWSASTAATSPPPRASCSWVCSACSSTGPCSSPTRSR